jgi:aspartyl-tRNA(Asn)/glutamyl-tRNA(Gln) amidotransferase subunit A
MINHSVAELIDGLSQKKFSSEELTKAYLNRIKTLDSKLNSFVTLLEEEAVHAAQASDIRRQKNALLSPLDGIPIAQKDNFCTKGVKTSCGSKMLDNFVAPYNATTVERFEQAGMVLLGKTNMDEFAMGSSNENSYYGPVKNPWDLERVPGGSSGGSAAAVAARFTPASTGTDTGGSIRQPAAFCGISGIKPTYGRVSRYGMVAFASSLDQGGPLAATAEDLALLLNVMAGFDEKDSTSASQEVPDYTKTLSQDIQGLRIGVPKEYFEEGLDKDMAKIIEETIKVYEQLGAKIVSISLPSSHLSIPAYYVVAPAECSSNLARYDGVRYGYRCENPVDLEDLYTRSRAEGFGPEVKRRIMIGTYVLSSGFYDAYYLKAQKIRHLISEDFRQAFTQVDVILSPTTPTPAFKIGEKTNDPISMYLSDIYTAGANLAGLPGIALPSGFMHQLPVGHQLIGNYFSEARLLNIGYQYQKNTTWHQQQPNFN